MGFSCERSEVSGARLWGLLRDEFGPADRMAREVFVSNYCPLMFLDEEGKNLTPDRIGKADQESLFAVCDRYLETVVETLRPEWLVGIGRFAEERLVAMIAANQTGRHPRHLHHAPQSREPQIEQ